MRKKKTILLVDDDEAVRDVICGILEQDYKVIEASRCAEVRSLLNCRPDLVILDYMLPDGNGFDVLKLLRQEDLTVPAIMITAHSDEELVIQAIRKEVADYIRKPIRLVYLRNRLAEIFGKARDRDAAESFDTREENLIEGIVAFIDKNYMKDLRLDVMARMACMSRFKFSRVFRIKSGQTFISYLNSVRLGKAVQLLDNPDLGIAEIAYAAGYRNVPHFDRVFKAAYKTSPTEYRKKTLKLSG